MTEEEKQVASGGNTRQIVDMGRRNLRIAYNGNLLPPVKVGRIKQLHAQCTCIITVMVLAGFQPDRIAMGITPGNNIS